MAWPSAADFSEAVQSPRAAFRDSELQGGQPELNNLGMPKPRSGGFAVVFKLQCGSRNWAVKCFTHDFADQRQRYDAISRHLAEKHLPYTVGFRYLQDGIRIRGQMYPILKMEWVEGANLREYVQRHLTQPQILRNLASQWATMLRALHAASIAHGDLQDRNIIIVNDALRLIDYDGMFVPNLTGYTSHELGASNYQHPHRSEHDFGPSLDNFSAWVVYLSLIGLAAQPQLWRKFGAEDERLILGCGDFNEPSKSEVLKILESSPAQDVRSVARLFRSLLYLRLADIPSLDGQIDLPDSPSIAREGSWLDDHVSNLRSSKHKSNDLHAPAAPTLSDPTWILEGLAGRDSVSWAFEHSLVPERIVLGFSIVGVSVTILLWYLGFSGYYLPSAAAIFVSISDSAFLIVRFVTDSAVKATRPVYAKAREISSLRRTTQRDLDQVAKKSLKVRLGLKDEQNKIDTTRSALNEDEQKAVLKAHRAVQSSSNQLQQRIQDLDGAEAREITDFLSALQQRHVHAWMVQATLDNARIPGIGQAFKISLMVSGYRTAFDIDRGIEHISGIGPMRSAALMFWRQQVESQARASAPTSLSRNDEAAIRSKYIAQRNALQMQADAINKGMADKEREIRGAYKVRNESLEGQAEFARRRCDEELKNIDHQSEQFRKALFRVNWDAAKLDRELTAVKNIRFGRYLAAVFLPARRA